MLFVVVVVSLLFMSPLTHSVTLNTALGALFLFANYVSPRWAGWIGLLFVIGRIVYARSYVADPGSRGTGFVIGFAANAVLVLGAFLGALF